MDPVAAWFAGQADRERRAVLLEDALIGGRFLPYVFYRLRYWLARYALASAVQVIQVLVLHRLFPREGFLVLVGLLALASLVTAGWWGVLEILRTRIRDLYQAGAPHQIPALIGRWLSGAIRIGAVLVAGAAGFLAWRAATLPEGLGPVEVTAAAILLRVAVDLPRRCYHSGLYALRRVYRPLPSMLALEVVSVGALLILVPWLGPWAAAAAELIAIGIVASMSVFYTARGYRLAGLAPQRHLSVLSGPGRRPGRRTGSRGHRPRVAGALRAGILPGLAAALMSLDSIVVLGVFAAVDARGASWPFALLVAAMAPSVRAGFDWAQLLYFDLKRLERRPFANLRATFTGRARMLAPLLGIGFWAVGGAAGTVVLGPAALGLELGLLPFFVGASFLALGQMDAFAARAYRPVIASGGVLAVGLLAIAPLSTFGIGPAAWLDATVLLALGTLVFARRLPFLASRGDGDLLPTDWLDRLAREPRAVRLGAIQVGGPGPQRTAEVVRSEAWRARRLAQRIAERLDGSGAVSRFGDDAIGWYERNDDGRPARVDGTWLLRVTGARLGHVRQADAVHGAAALAVIASWDLGGPAGARAGVPGPPELDRPGAGSTRDSLVETFQRAFPGGLVVSPDHPQPAVLEGLAARERRLVLSEALRYARGLSPSSARFRFDVTAYCPAGALELIFLVERSRSKRDDRTRWRAALRGAHLAGAVAAAGGPAT